VLQPCDHPCGINRMIKPALYGAVDQMFTAKLCAQLGVELNNSNSALSFLDAVAE